MTASHREIWEHFVNNEELAAALDPRRDTGDLPPSPAEERFILLVLLHAATVFHAIKVGALERWPGWDADVEAFFALPVPASVAKRFLRFQEPAFRDYLAGIIDHHKKGAPSMAQEACGCSPRR